MKDINLPKNCPRFSKCNCPICPLDPDKDIRIYLKGDPKCTLAKSIRLRLGKELPWKGLSPKELAGIKSWKCKNKESITETLKILTLGRQKNQFPPAFETKETKNG